MRTVAWLRNELSKFPDDAVCFAYEGEVTGIVIERLDADGEPSMANQGIIYCSEDDEYDRQHETKLLPPE